jgi:hypothetical protein
VGITAPERSPAADPRLRGALLMPACALAVHQLRYALVFGGHTAPRLAQQGHGYLSAVEPFALLAGAIAAGAFVGRLARAWHSGDQDASARGLDGKRAAARTWLTCALALLAVYCAQELIEGALAPGHPAGLAGVFGSGGWIAIPLALAIGGALTTALKVADTLVRFTAAGPTSPVWRPAPARPRPRHPYAISGWRLDPASGVAPGRAPPPSFSNC